MVPIAFLHRKVSYNEMCSLMSICGLEEGQSLGVNSGPWQFPTDEFRKKWTQLNQTYHKTCMSFGSKRKCKQSGNCRLQDMSETWDIQSYACLYISLLIKFGLTSQSSRTVNSCFRGVLSADPIGLVCLVSVITNSGSKKDTCAS